jgi:uncharacterized protein YdbL (DUF1318 family)
MNMRKFGILLGTLLTLSSPAWALDLHAARSAGQVGEKADGYVAARAQTPEVLALVAEVNARRKQEYARISQENKQPVDVVAKLAAQQIVNGLEKGAYYQTSSGSWAQR